MVNKIEIFRSPDNQVELQVQMDADTVWLTQEQMEDLFHTTKQNVSLHINNVFAENELDKKSTVKESLTVRNEGSRQVKRNLKSDGLPIIDNATLAALTLFIATSKTEEAEIVKQLIISILNRNK